MLFALSTFLLNRGLAPEMARRAAWGIVLFGVALVLFALLLGVRSCYVRQKQEQTRTEINEIREGQINANVNKQIATIEVNAAKAETETRKAHAADIQKQLEEARKTDSSKERAEAWAALQRYCQNYKDDSICK